MTRPPEDLTAAARAAFRRLSSVKVEPGHRGELQQAAFATLRRVVRLQRRRIEELEQAAAQREAHGSAQAGTTTAD